MINKQHVNNSIEKALRGESNIDNDILSIRGFSTPTMRHLFNNLCNIKEGNYLEIGLYCGATFCSSFNKDTVSIGIEDFSQDFGVNSVKSELENNFNINKNKAKDAHIFNSDCFDIDVLKYPFGINVFCYDGEHSEENQARALPHFIDNMANTFLYIVDDTNWDQVIKGTMKGIMSLSDKIEVVDDWNLVGNSISDDTIWHNGVRIFLINKK